MQINHDSFWLFLLLFVLAHCRRIRSAKFIYYSSQSQFGRCCGRLLVALCAQVTEVGFIAHFGLQRSTLLTRIKYTDTHPISIAHTHFTNLTSMWLAFKSFRFRFTVFSRAAKRRATKSNFVLNTFIPRLTLNCLESPK